jgi:multicomponent Na+:H+ antiporter subunit F
MPEALLAAAAFVLATVGVGLVRLLRGPTDVDRVMAVQLLGTGGAAVLVLVAAATATPAVVDVALVVALVAAFASAAFVTSQGGDEAGAPDAE